MGNDVDRVVALANKITAKAEGTLAGLEREMTIMKWPAEYRAILWEAIAEIASRRADTARQS